MNPKKQKTADEQKLLDNEQNESIRMLLKLGFDSRDKVDALGGKINQVEGKLNQVDEKVDANKKETDEKIAALEKLLLQQKSASISSGSGGRPPGLDNFSDVSSVATDFSAMALARKSWRPLYIEVKGWVTNWRCPAQGP